MKNTLSLLAVLLILASSTSLTSSCKNNKVDDEPEPDSTETNKPDDDGGQDELPDFNYLDFIDLPDGFYIHEYATVENARSMDLSPNGVLFVGNRAKDKVYAVVDRDKDYEADTAYVLASGLRMPNGVAFRNGDLYIAEVSRILRLNNIEDKLENPPAPEVINDNLPDDGWHGWKYIAFGPDDKLYVPVGAPCNTCEREYPFSHLLRMNPDGSQVESIAEGIRNTVGFDWHPVDQSLWFTDNGRDNMGDNVPPDELNRLDSEGQHFGFPYCHGGEHLDPEFGEDGDCEKYEPPVQQLGPHVASLGIEFYEGDMFPAEYKNQPFIAEHGSWNRTEPIGYRVSIVKTDVEGKNTEYIQFAEGWLSQSGEKKGRPVDIEELPDGSILVSDDAEGKIYRIFYQP